MATKKVDWYYRRSGCNTCKKMDAFLEEQSMEANETVSANKEKLGPEAALALAKDVTKIVAARGKSVVEIRVKDADEELLKKHLVEKRRLLGIPKYEPDKEPLYDVTKISQLLPHRYPFLLVDKIIELTEDIADELFEAGCGDGTPGTCEGVFSIDFHRQAESLEQAIRSAIGNVKAAGYQVERVEIAAEAMPQPA